MSFISLNKVSSHGIVVKAEDSQPSDCGLNSSPPLEDYFSGPIY